MYTPLNNSNFNAAFSAAMSAIGFSNRSFPTSATPSSYSNFANIAGAFAQSVDTALGGQATPASISLLNDVCKSVLEDRGGLTSTDPADYDSAAQAIVAIIVAQATYYFGETIPTGGNGAFLHWQYPGSPTGNPTFMYGWGMGDGTGDPVDETPSGIVIPIQSGILQNLRAKASANVTNAVTILVRKNGVDTTLTCTIAAGQNSAVDSDISHGVSVEAGDVISIAITFAGANSDTILAGVQIN